MSFIEHLERESTPTPAMYRDALRMALTTVDEVSMAAAHRLATDEAEWLIELASATGAPSEDVAESLGTEPVTPPEDDALRLAAILDVLDKPFDEYAMDAIWHQFDQPDDMRTTLRAFEPGDASYAGRDEEVGKLVARLREHVKASSVAATKSG